MKNFVDYFSNIEDYPTIGYKILPMGTLYQYVSNDFFNGFINYITILKAFILGRYHKWDENIGKNITYDRIC